MGRRHYRVTIEDVTKAHHQALTYGGLPGVINPGGLASAIARPYNGHYPLIWSKAAALAESLVRNHPFTDGNKRTAFIVVIVFLDLSGWTLGLDATPAAVEDLMLRIARGELRFAEIEDWFRRNCVSPAQLERIRRAASREGG